jgi:hypothetical protein
LAAVQVPEQQAWPAAPQVPQAPDVVMLHVPFRFPHVLPEATHIPRTQQPPEPQALLSQQICPLPPQEMPDLVVDPPHAPATANTVANPATTKAVMKLGDIRRRS